MIVTTHIAMMYDEAARLARELHGGEMTMSDISKTLERIDNLVTHARAELEDERLRARDGWPVV